jgi:PAS domain S-box-containing protein
MIKTSSGKPLYVLFIGIFFILLACTPNASHQEAPRAVRGQLDLTQWNFDTDGPVKLSGEWAFYWKKLLDAEKPSGEPHEGTIFIRVPGIWNGHEVAGKKIPGSGYATYRLKVLLKPTGTPMAFKFLSMGTAFDLYVNGKKVSSAGIVGKTPETMAPEWLPHVVGFTPVGDRMDLVLHVSNFHHRKGGALEVIHFGAEKDIREMRERSLALDLFLSGSIFIMGLYHLVLFYIRKQDRTPLYFSVFCLLIALYGLLSGERYFAQIFPGADWELRIRLTNLTSFLSVPVFLLFIHSLFPGECKRPVFNALSIPLILLSFVVLLTPARVYSQLIPVYHLLTLIAALYTLYILILAVYRKREGALILLVGTCVMVLTIVNDVLYDNTIIRTGQFINLGIFVFIFSQSVLLSARFSKALETVESQTRELTGTNLAFQQEIQMRKEMEEALKVSEEKYRLLIENASDAIFILQDDHIKYHNRKTEEATGYNVEELSRIPFIDHLHPGDRDFIMEKHWKRLSSETFPSGSSFRIKTKSGEERWASLNAVMITWEKRPAILCFVRDVTQQKTLEASLQRAQKMEAIGTLAAGVAHDLNNVLSGIVSYPELLLLDIPPDSPMREPIESIQRAGLKAAAIVTDLLTLARRGVKINEVCHLNDVVQDYLKSAEYATLKSFHDRIVLETHLSQDLLNIMGSPFHLSKALMNLVSNAAEAMPDGGKISVSTGNLTIDSSTKGYDQIEAGDYVTLAVSDSGIGISPEDREKIFEPFYSKKVMGRSGTGLGMAVVWGTVKDHGGHIDLKSTVGQGTVFTLYFPATRRERVKEKTRLSIEEYKGRGESILVVDDLKEQREIASAILTQLGYSVTTVASGEKAVEYVKDHRVDLMVLDMIMDPGIDGLETYKRILKNHSRQRAIITSGFSETDHVREAQNLGVGAYIKKPYTLEKLGTAVRSELERT